MCESCRGEGCGDGEGTEDRSKIHDGSKRKQAKRQAK